MDVLWSLKKGNDGRLIFLGEMIAMRAEVRGVESALGFVVDSDLNL